MYKFLFPLFGLFLSISLQATEIPVSSKISDVTVFLRGAQISRTGSEQIPSGQHYLIFSDLEENLTSSSIQVNGTGKFMIMDIKQRFRYIPVEVPDSVPRLLKALKQKQDSLALFNYSRSDINSKIQTLQKERNLITSSPIMNGSSIGDSLELLVNAASYMREKLFEIDKLSLDFSTDLNQVQNQINRVNRDIQDLNRLIQENRSNKNKTKRVSEILVQVLAENTTRGSLTLSYLVNGPSWYPEYDIKADGLTEPVNFTYKARVTQNTGYDWKGVNLTFSTNDPIDSKNKPILVPWVITLDSPRPYPTTRSGSAPTYLNEVQVIEESKASSDEFEIQADDISPAPNSGTMTVESSQLVTTEFKVDLPYTIPSDREMHYLVLKTYELKADFQYVAVPKRNKHAYLMARVAEWKNIHILPSQAHVFYGGTYVGETFIDPNQFRDTLELGLGQDKRLRVERSLSKDENKDETFTNYRNRYLEFCYKITHSGNQSIPLKIEDQIPISRVEKIEVKLRDDEKPAQYEESTGMISWEVDLKQGETMEWKSGFNIRYPKDKVIYGL